MDAQSITPFEAPELPVGTVLDGKYEILACIGRGGFGAVYRARHLELGNEVAIKTLRSWLSHDLDAVQRFHREAQIIANLRHKNLVQIYSFGETADLKYMAMELVQGLSLAKWIGDRGPMLPDQAVSILIQICDAMTYAHQHYVLHRDLKPSNVMIQETTTPPPDAQSVTDDTTTHVKVVDFGLAKLLGKDQADQQRLTQTGDVVGDPAYMSPEQCQGRPLDERTDIYSFGCLMYELFTGVPPFTADAPVAVLFKHVSDEPEPFARKRGIPIAWEQLTQMAMTKDKMKRVQSFEEMAALLRKVRDNPQIKLSPVVSTRRRGGGGGTTGASKAIPASIAALLIVASACAAYFVYRANNPDEETTALTASPVTTDARVSKSVALGNQKLMTARTYFDCADYQSAYNEATDALKLKDLSFPDRLGLLVAAGDAARRLNKLEEAEQYYQTVGLTPTGEFVSDELMEKVSMNLIRVKLSMGKRVEAEKLLEKVYAGAKHFDRADLEGDALQELFYLKLELKKIDEAQRLVDAMDSSWVAIVGFINPALPLKQVIYIRTNHIDKADALVRDSLAKPMLDWDRSGAISSFSQTFAQEREYARAARLNAQLHQLAKRATPADTRPAIDVRARLADLHLLAWQGKDDEILKVTPALFDALMKTKKLNNEMRQLTNIYCNALIHKGRQQEVAPFQMRAAAYFDYNLKPR